MKKKDIKKRIIKPEIVKDHKKIIEYVDEFDY